MKLKLKILLKCLGSIFLVVSIYYNCNAQNPQQPNTTKRAKDNFDFSWQFHKGDIAMKFVARVGQGGITDINVPVITRKDTVIDYTDGRWHF